VNVKGAFGTNYNVYAVISCCVWSVSDTVKYLRLCSISGKGVDMNIEN